MKVVSELRIFYPEGNVEDIIGVVDYRNKLIEIIEVKPDNPQGFKERGFVNMAFVKKAEIVRKIGCIMNKEGSGECLIRD